MDCRVEFFIQPFTEGAPGPHVNKGIEAVSDRGFEVEFGPFGSGTTGEIEELAPALAEMLIQAISSGADRISITVERRQ